MKNLNYYYRVLELSPDASIAEIKSVYRVMVKVWHPDRFEINSEVYKKANIKLIEINEAYQYIMEYVKKQSRENYEAAYYPQDASAQQEEASRQEKTRAQAEAGQQAERQKHQQKQQEQNGQQEEWLRQEEARQEEYARLQELLKNHEASFKHQSRTVLGIKAIYILPVFFLVAALVIVLAAQYKLF